MAGGGSIGRRAIAPALLIVMAAAGCSDGRPARAGEHAPGSATTITVATGTCGQGWSDPHGGAQSFRLRNSGDLPVQADLVDPKTGAVYAEAEGIGPGTSRFVQLTVGRGRYAFRCIPADGSTVLGPTVSVTSGPRRGAPGVVPVSPAELIAALKRYNAYVTSGLATLRTRTAALAQAAGSGDRLATERAWLPAHLSYEKLGAAYGAFGDFAESIDGIPAGKPRGVDHPDLAGFHRIEFLLWHGGPMSQVTAAVGSLQHDVRALQAEFPDERIDPNDLALRAHEILEAALQFELTGDSDQGSGTNLATVDANIAGTEAVLQALAPALKSRYSLRSVHATLSRLRSLIRAQHQDDRWTSVLRLSRREREQIAATTGEALEQLAPVAAIAGVRQTE